jgi:hypothetical protein
MQTQSRPGAAGAIIRRFVFGVTCRTTVEVSMKRREFVEKLGVGSAAAAFVSSAGLTDASKMTEHGKSDDDRHDHDHDHHRPVRGALASATVSFGQWKADPAAPVDRYPNVSPAPANTHLLIPHQVTIKLGGSVNFIISGLHQVIVYAPGTKPTDINPALTRPTTGTPAGVLLINDPLNRLYCGSDPSVFLAPTPLRDRVEVVQFLQVGRHLVICGVQGHFLDNMFGWVRVVENDDD